MAQTRARLWLLAALAGLACVKGGASPAETPAEAPADTLAETPAIEAAREFQASYDRELREDPRSFLTVIAAHYLGPGERLSLRLVEGRWTAEQQTGEQRTADTDPDTIRFEAQAEVLASRRGEDETLLRETTLVEAGDPRFAFKVSRQGQDWRILVHDAEAPLRTEFPGVGWFPVDGAMIVEATFEAAPTRAPKPLQTSRGTTKTLYLAGRLRFVLGGRELELQAFAYAPEARAAEPWLVPFRDGTSGESSYAAGRYLELEAPEAEGAQASVRLDFNRATNPLCAYSEHFNCPMPPRFNDLDVAIEAGARAPASGH